MYRKINMAIVCIAAIVGILEILVFKNQLAKEIAQIIFFAGISLEMYYSYMEKKGIEKLVMGILAIVLAIAFLGDVLFG